ncbi:FCD domain-containing protein [Streptomyces sp. Inha503]|uniref:FCD domain-containing protein n=1 Tax=Streptomyces sp. Inha503 TaxID=3383314 RepID=UPI0039A387BF
MAARRAAERITEVELEQARSLASEMADTDDVAGRVFLHRAFHLLLFGTARSSRTAVDRHQPVRRGHPADRPVPQGRRVQQTLDRRRTSASGRQLRERGPRTCGGGHARPSPTPQTIRGRGIV